MDPDAEELGRVRGSLPVDADIAAQPGARRHDNAVGRCEARVKPLTRALAGLAEILLDDGDSASAIEHHVQGHVGPEVGDIAHLAGFERPSDKMW